MGTPGQTLCRAHQGKRAGHKKPAEEVERCGIKYRQAVGVGDGGTRKAPDRPRGLLQKDTGTEEGFFSETEK